MRHFLKFRLCRWGSSLLGCAHLTCPVVPPMTRAEIFMRTCLQSHHLPQPHRSHIWSFRTLGQLFKIPPISAQICHSAGGSGGPPILLWSEWSYLCYLGYHAKFQNPLTFFSLIGILTFLWLRSPCKFQNPTTIPSGRMSTEERKKEREEREKKHH